MDLTGAVNIASDFLTGIEGFRPTAYWDVNGYAIGYGNHYYQDGSAVAGGDTITQSQAQALLAYTAGNFANGVLNRVTVPLNNNQLAALTSLAYNCGSVPYSLANVINRGGTEDDIRGQWGVTCVTSGGVYNQELANRRAMEADLYFQNVVPAWAAGIAIIAAIAIAGYLAFKA